MKLFILILFICHSALLVAQGPIDGFHKGKGNLDMSLGINFSRSKDYFGQGNKVYQLPYSAEMISVFGQYGITDKIDVVATIPFVFGEFENKFQDMGLYVKYRPLYKEINKVVKLGAIVSAGYTFPMSNYSPDSTGALGQRAHTIPLRLVAQLDFNFGLFFNLTGTYNIRADKLSEQTIINTLSQNPSFVARKPDNSGVLLMRLGMATSHHFIEFMLEYQETFGGVNYKPNVAQPSQLYGIDYLKVGGTYYYGFETNGIALNASYIPKGRNIGNIFSISLSFILKFKELDKKNLSNE